jgi:hypothetical protein
LKYADVCESDATEERDWKLVLETGYEEGIKVEGRRAG